VEGLAATCTGRAVCGRRSQGRPVSRETRRRVGRRVTTRRLSRCRGTPHSVAGVGTDSGHQVPRASYLVEARFVGTPRACGALRGVEDLRMQPAPSQALPASVLVWRPEGCGVLRNSDIDGAQRANATSAAGGAAGPRRTRGTATLMREPAGRNRRHVVEGAAAGGASATCDRNVAGPPHSPREQNVAAS